VSLANEALKQKSLNAEIDHEIDGYKEKFEEVQQELQHLDKQIGIYEELICEKDG